MTLLRILPYSQRALAPGDDFDRTRRSVNPDPISGPEDGSRIGIQTVNDWNPDAKERLSQKRAHYDHRFALHVHDGRGGASVPHGLEKDARSARGSPTMGEEEDLALKRRSAQIMSLVDYRARLRIDALPETEGLL